MPFPRVPDPIALTLNGQPEAAPPVGRSLVVSDVHGCRRTLMALLDRLALAPGDRLFLLGDYVNKGPDSAGVLETLFELQQAGYALYPLRGNHEQMWLDADAEGPHACQTLARQQNAPGLLDARGRLRPRFGAFMAALPCYVALDRAWLVHAGFDFAAPAPLEAWPAMLEIRDFPVDRRRLGDRPVIHGHDPQPLAVIRQAHEALASGGLVLPLDNGCVYHGERAGQGHLLALDLATFDLIAQPNVEHVRVRAFIPTPAPPRTPALTLDDVVDYLEATIHFAEELEQRFAEELDGAAPTYRDSLANLLHYIALRHRDLRPVQQRLGELGISRLGRAEGHVLASVHAVKANVERLSGRSGSLERAPAAVTFARGPELLQEHATNLLGTPVSGRPVRIMVTLPSEAATDYALVRDLIALGADAIRINCAHDGAAAWDAMIGHVRRADRETGRGTFVCMDLAGPKLRVGALAPGPQVLRLRPERDRLGRVVEPYRVWLAPAEEPPPEAGVVHVPVAGAAWPEVEPADTLRFRDARGKKRTWTVTARTERGLWAEGLATAYLVPETRLRHRRGKEKRQALFVGALPALEEAIRLRVGDVLLVHREDRPGEPARYDANDVLVAPAHVPCPLPELYADVRPGEPIAFDDGRIEGVIRDVSDGELRVEITHARAGAARLRAHKGINLPESRLRFQGLTEKDRDDLAFVARHADVVSLSFVNEPEDVLDLYAELERLQAPDHLGVLLKVETQRGVHDLPTILMAAMRRAPLGVMIARGDLAVECGWEHLARVQEELLHLCEAAHVPIVWATQVLESVAKQGRPSRAEITDAAMSQRAECVMLNKGPYVREAVAMLDEILVRMQQIQHKKAPMLPTLQLPEGLLERLPLDAASPVTLVRPTGSAA